MVTNPVALLLSLTITLMESPETICAVKFTLLGILPTMNVLFVLFASL